MFHRITARYFKLNSLSLRIFAALLALMLLMSVMLYGMISRFMYDNVRYNMRNEYQHSTASYMNASDERLKSIQQSIIQLSNENDVVNAAIISGINKKEHFPRNLEILSLLHNYRQYVGGIESIWLYEYLPEELYTSSDVVCGINEYPGKEEILSVLKSAPDSIIEDGRFGSTCIKSVNGSLYLCRDFMYSIHTPLSVLIVRLDKNYLFSPILENPSRSFAIFGASDQDVLMASGAGALEPLGAALSSSRDDLTLGSWTGDIYLLRSPYCGWTYALEYDTGFASLDLGQTLRSILPVFIFFMVVCLIFSFMISGKISKPIQNIVASMSNRDDESSARLESAKNEVEFLQNEYHYSIQKESDMKNVLQHISSEVLDRLFSELIDEKSDTPAEIRKILDNTRTGFSMDGKYCMILAAPADGQSMEDPRFREYILALNEIASSQTAGFDCGQYSFLKDGRLLFVLGFQEDAASRMIFKCMNRVYKKMKLTTENWSVKIFLGKSFSYPGIQNLHVAYEDALGNLKQHISDGAASAAEPEDSADNYEQSIRTIGEVKLLNFSRELEKGNFSSAETILDSLYEELPSGSSDEDKSFIYTQLFELLTVQETMKHIVTEPETLHDDCYRTISSGSVLQDDSALREYSAQILAGLDSVYQRRKNKYVTQAKEYIETHFSESGLSLTETADSLNINKSYLSTLFNEVLDMKFVDYLNSVRVGKAREMLQNSDLPINEISERTGFNSVQNFIRVFKKYVGVTPGQYRKRSGS